MKKLKKQITAFIIINLINVMLYIYPYEETHELSIQLFGEKEMIRIIGDLLHIILMGIIPIFFVFLFITLNEYLYGKINLVRIYIITVMASLSAILIFYLLNQLSMAAAMFITAAIFIFILFDYSLRTIMVKVKNNKK